MGASMRVRPVTVLLCCLVIYSADVDAVRFRTSSSYRSSSYSSSRSSRTASLSGSIRTAFSSRLQTYAISRGLFYSSNRYRSRYTGNSQPEGISLCFNVNDALTPEQSAAVVQPWYYQNRTVLGLFVCPLDDNADMKYCCGDELGETCCTFWQNPGRLAGVIIAIVVFIVFGAVMAWKFGRRCFSFGSSGGTAYAAGDVKMDNVATVAGKTERTGWRI